MNRTVAVTFVEALGARVVGTHLQQDALGPQLAGSRVHLLEHGATVAVALVLGEHADGLNVGGVGYDHGSAVADSAPAALVIFRTFCRQFEHVVGSGRVGQLFEEHVDVPGVGGEQGGFHAVHGLHVGKFGNAQAGTLC